MDMMRPPKEAHHGEQRGHPAASGNRRAIPAATAATERRCGVKLEIANAPHERAWARQSRKFAYALARQAGCCAAARTRATSAT